EPQPGSNYWWGYVRNALNCALAIWYEDTTRRAQLYNRLFIDSPNFWDVSKQYNSAQAARGGIAPEGTEYGRYMIDYITVAFASLAQMGRNLYGECSFWSDAVTAFVYMLSPSPMRGDQGTTDFYQLPVYWDTQSPYTPLNDTDSVGGWAWYFANWLLWMAQA